MSTSNFRSNAGTVFAVNEPSQEDVIASLEANWTGDEPFDETKVTDDDVTNEFNFLSDLWSEDAIDNVTEELNTDKRLSVTSEDYYDDDRSYGGHIFAGVSLVKTHSDILYPELELMTRGGYYTGGNFDYNIKIASAYSGDHFDLEDLASDVVAEELQGYNDRRPSAAQTLATLKHLNLEVENLKKYVEAILTRNTTPLTRVATFSNGESLYQKVAA